MTTSLLSATPGPDVGVVRCDGAVLDRQYAEMIAESIPHIVWTASPDGATTYFNRQGTDYTGCPRETNYEWNWVTLVHPEDIERAAHDWQRLPAGLPDSPLRRGLQVAYLPRHSPLRCCR